MQTSWFTEALRSDLEAVGSMGSDKAMKVADRMITVTLPLAKARMLEAMSMALTELSGVLGIERIDLRVSGDDVAFVPPGQGPQAPPMDPPGWKARIESRAENEGISTNTWIVRALEGAVGRGGPHGPRGRRLSGFGHA